MARIRTIKPEFPKHEGLFDAEKEYKLPLRLAFACLWMCADREGRFEWRPRALKTDILPYDDLDFSHVLDALLSRGFVEKYVVDGVAYGWIPSFKRHQVINNKERNSILPEPKKENILNNDLSTREPRVINATSTPLSICQGEGEGEGEGKGKDISNTNVLLVTKTKTPPCPIQEIIDLYHELMPTCKRVRIFNDTKKKSLRRRWEEDKARQDLGWWRNFFGFANESKWLTGQVVKPGEEKPWSASLGWLILPENFAKVINEDYHR